MKIFKAADWDHLVAEPEFLYFKFWRIDATKFVNGTHHEGQPKVSWGFKVVKVDMTVNSPLCRILRIWIYTKGPAYCIDFRKPKWLCAKN
jgi:hypothetical protein